MTVGCAGEDMQQQQYRRACLLLEARVADVQRDNERVAARVRAVRRAERRARVEVRRLAECLDRHHATSRPTPRSTPRPTPRARAPRAPRVRDPRAPKKPCNAFFQFCQEQRPLMSGAGGELELTRRLAQRWRQLSAADKRVYVAMFERSKQHYRDLMSAYSARTS